MQAYNNSAAHSGKQNDDRGLSTYRRLDSPQPPTQESELEPTERSVIAHESSNVQIEQRSNSPESVNTDEQGPETPATQSSNQEKRRAQNRSAQRAFRIRKIRKVKHLEQNLVTLLAQHNDLLTSYEQQEGELRELRDRISAMQSELAELQATSGRDQDYGDMALPDQREEWNFDAFLAPTAASAQGFNANLETRYEGSGHDFNSW